MIGDVVVLAAIAVGTGFIGAAAGILLGRRLDRGDDGPAATGTTDAPPGPPDTEDDAPDERSDGD